jgi:hypothetical protein
MEFLDLNLTKESRLLLHALQSPFYWRILKKKPFSTLVLKIRKKNSSSSFIELPATGHHQWLGAKRFSTNYFLFTILFTILGIGWNDIFNKNGCTG